MTPSTQQARATDARGARATAVALATAVLLLAATTAAVAAPADQRIYQVDPIPGTVEQFDFFGWVLATGDFDGDRHDDLVISARDESLGSITGAGAVHIIYGSAKGLKKKRNQRFHQNTTGIADRAETTDNFGDALAAGDFNGDGFDDLAVGVPNEDRKGVEDAGVVHVIFGTAKGLRARGDQLIERGANGIKGTPQNGDRFGASLAAGDIDRNGRADLVIGATGDDIGGVVDAGSISVVFGGRAGLTKRDQLVSQATNGIQDSPETGDAFGTALALGDLDGDRFADVVVGTPNESFINVSSAGTVHVLFGSKDGVQTSLQLWQNSFSGSVNEPGDEFGRSVDIGRRASGTARWLLVGAPGEDADQGWVGTTRVTRNGLLNGVSGIGPQAGWRYGQVVAWGRAKNFAAQYRSAPNSTGTFDGADVTGGVVFGGGTMFEQDTGPWDPAPNDGFGQALATGDFDRDGNVDLAVGIPFKDINGLDEAGAVSVYYDARTLN